jgi:hypothetical protein
MNMRDSFIVLAAAVSASLMSNMASGAGLELVVKNTDAVPSIAGAAWATSTPFSAASIDDAGNVAFRASLLAGTGGVTATDNTTAYYGAPGSLSLFARTGNPGPGLPGVNVTSFNVSNIGVSGNGQIYFAGATAAPNGYAAIGTVAGGFTKVARNGDVLPGVGGVAISSNPAQGLNYFYANNAGQSAIYATLTGGTSSGLWIGNGANLQLAFQTGQPHAGLPTGGTPKGAGVTMINGSATLFSSFLMNNVTGSIDQNNNEMLTTLPFGGSSFTTIGREGDAAPGCGGATYLRGLFDPGLGLEFSVFNAQVGNFNNAGHAIYSTGLEGTGVVAGNNSAMFYYDGSSAQLLRRRGDTTTAVLGGAVLNFNSSTALSARLNNNDTMVLPTSLITGTGGVTTSNDSVLLRTQLGSSSDDLIAREGSNVSVAPGALFGNGYSTLLQNNAGQIVFSNTLTDDPNDPNNNVTTSNDLALFAWDPNAGLSLVAREGDSLASIGLNMTLTGSWLSMNTNPNVEGGAFALSDSGWLTFRASGTALAGFSDTSGIVRTQIVPEPASVGLLALLSPLMMRRRRRA